MNDPHAAQTISVVICTHNRADYLPKAIESVIDQALPGDEILVVDNASTDRTPAVARSFEGRGPLRYVFEEKIGLCHARNTGWRSAAGKFVAYLDDDAIASPGWLAAIRDAFKLMPTAGVVGGRVDPIWQGERPAWLSDEIALSLTIVDWSSEPKVIPDVRVQWLVGANMAFPVEVLAEVGGFDSRLDRMGGNMLSGGDVYLQEQIIRKGYACLYFPAMAVRHLVPVSRLNKKWFRRRYYWQGISDAVMYGIRHAPVAARQRWRHAMQRTWQLLAAPQRLSDLVLSSDDPAQFTRKCFLLIEVGFIAGLIGFVRR
jgi:glycosyltransferase involved in cell wall biosynthesis